MSKELIDLLDHLIPTLDEGPTRNLLEMCKSALAQQQEFRAATEDCLLYGTGIMLNGKRIDPAEVCLYPESQQQEAEPVGEIPEGFKVCPISGREFWGNIEHPELGLVATYGGPFDTYTIPSMGEDGELRCERFDQDEGAWVEGGEPFGWLYEDQQAHESPKPAAQPQVPEGARRSAPQDVEEFIAESAFYAEVSNVGVPAIAVDDLRAWMSGHVRVPVGSIRRAIYALERFANDTLAGRNSAHELHELLNASKGEPDPDLWCVHILGPDDLHAAPSRAYAEVAADLHNRRFSDLSAKLDVVCKAVAAPWPYSRGSHAEDVASFIDDWFMPEPIVSRVSASKGE